MAGLGENEPIRSTIVFIASLYKKQDREDPRLVFGSK